MVSKAIELDQNFLEKIFKRKSMVYVDVSRGNGILLLDCVDKKHFKIRYLYENKKYKDVLIVVISFKEKHFSEIDKAVKKANDKAILAGFSYINDVYEDMLDIR